MELEEAKKELEKLETLYPNQHQYLKHELKSFISQLQLHSHTFSQPNTTHIFLDTEESTNLDQTKKIQLVLPNRNEEEKVMEKKKGGESSELESPKSVVVKHFPGSRKKKKKNKRKDRVDLVLEKAQICLKKIRLFKSSFFSPP